MTLGNDPDTEAPLFSALLTPHRSLGGPGFLALIAAFGAISFAVGMMFLLMGAWPVSGFFGLDAALLYWAFRANYRAANAREVVTVTPSALTVRKTCWRGRVAEWTLNPLWVRLHCDTHEEFGIRRMFLVSQGRRLPIATFLPPEEKKSFAAALNAAIGQAKRGPPRTILD